MAKCAVPSCKSINCDLFCAPLEKNKLRKWRILLKQEIESTVLICSIHFEPRFLIQELFLRQDAFPTILIDEISTRNDSCRCCLKEFESTEMRFFNQQSFGKLFFFATGFELSPCDLICNDCHNHFLQYERFSTVIKARHENYKQETSSKSQAISSEQNDEEENDVVILEKPVELIIVQDDLPRTPILETPNLPKPSLRVTSVSSKSSGSSKGRKQTSPVNSLSKLKKLMSAPRKEPQTVQKSSNSIHASSNPETPAAAFPCKKCPQSYKSAYFLKKHMIAEHSENAMLEKKNEDSKFFSFVVSPEQLENPNATKDDSTMGPPKVNFVPKRKKPHAESSTKKPSSQTKMIKLSATTV